MFHLCPFIVRYFYAFKMSLLSYWLASRLSLPCLPPSWRKTWCEQKMVQSCHICYHGSDLTANGLTAVIQIYLPPLHLQLALQVIHCLACISRNCFIVLYNFFLSRLSSFKCSVSIVVRLGAGLPGNRNLSCSPLSRVAFKNMWIYTYARLYIFMSHSA
jgi:hypothetical protein